jgi:hypothetical protein
MNKELSAVAHITFYDEDLHLQEEDIVITEVEDFADAMRRIEDYYSVDLMGVSIQLIDNKFVVIPSDFAEKLRNE